MGLLDYFWGARKKTKANVKKEVSGKCRELLQWSRYWEQLVETDHYISRKEYQAELQQYAETMRFFHSLDENDILEDYCVKNGFDASRARDLYHKYE